VTGRMIYIDRDVSMVGEGCSLYMKYENLLRRSETRTGSIVGVNGGIDAVRKSLYERMMPEHQPDFILPLRVIEKGYRVVFEPRSIVKESALKRSRDEYNMRVRVALRALYAIKEMKHLLNPIRYGFVSWQLLSHKVLRYCAFIFLVSLFITNLVMFGRDIVYDSIFLVQVAFYLSTLTGWLLERAGKGSRLLYIPFYFVIVNISSAHAFCKLILGERKVTWVPRRG